MHTISVRQPINLKVVRFELDFSALVNEKPITEKKSKKIRILKINNKKRSPIPPAPLLKNTSQKTDVKNLVEQLLDELYAEQRDWCNQSTIDGSRGSISVPSLASCQSNFGEKPETIERSYLEVLGTAELWEQKTEWEERLQITGEQLAKYVRSRDRLRRQQKRLCAAFTVLLRHITGDSGARFVVTPGAGEGPGEGGYAEWLHAMRLVARLPAGVPQHFRKKLWLTLSNRHLTARGIDWSLAERACFRGTSQPDDTELGAQILKDLHRTGCSLFCGAEGRENQAMLRRVLLAYARWNKDVGYCQGFNMLAAIILEVMDKSESDSLKVMIYLVEAVLPEGYFADDLRGLSADMAAFRDLLRLRMPRLAQHMDYLQKMSDGGGVEPPLPDVFTMQWFLTLYATWLPREALLRVWDLVLLDGNEVLLLTALAIWDLLQDRILSARSADEFYSCMGGGAGAVWEAGDSLVARVVALGSAPELPRLRSLHRYQVSPPAPPSSAPVFHPPLHSAMQITKRGLRLFYSEDEGDSSDDGNKMALATVIPRRQERLAAGDRLSLDIGALKRQYARLRERQRQAHVILAAACARHAAVGVSTSPTSLTVNNLLLGKSAIVSSRGRRLGPPPGAVPPSRQTPTHDKYENVSHVRSNETISWSEEKNRKSISRRNSVKWKDIKKDRSKPKERRPSIDLDEAGDGIIVSEHEAREIVASVRSRSSSETSSYSSHSSSSTDTSLCDENERGSESEHELPEYDKDKNDINVKSYFLSSQTLKDTKIISSPLTKTVISTPTCKNEVKCNLLEEPIAKDITDYLDSAAGIPLRTYIDGFEIKSNDSEIVSNENSFRLTSLSPCSSRLTLDRNEVLQRLNRTKYEEDFNSSELMRPTSFTKSPKNFTDLSPIDLSPCNYSLSHKSPYELNFDDKINQSSLNESTFRPPDIIDSLTMYPNFVPDIDLSDKNISDIESPPRSPGGESIIVSEDEPPIPLKIDKYFEHSPEFFGARVTDPNSVEIPNRRATKRISRLPKKPDSLTLQSTHNEQLLRDNVERASSLPQNLSFSKSNNSNEPKDILHFPEKEVVEEQKETFSPSDYILQTGRKNSERALQIIQENSKILSRILTKQHITDTGNANCKFTKSDENVLESHRNINTKFIPEKIIETKQIDSPLLKESTSDSLIGYRKRHNNQGAGECNDFIRIRPISIDDPFSLDVRNAVTRKEEFATKNTKSPSSECLGNKTDIYGWENKGFLAKSLLEKSESIEYDYRRTTTNLADCGNSTKKELTPLNPSDWNQIQHLFSGDSKTSVTLPSSELKDISTYERRFTSDEYNYPTSSKYNDFVLSKASDICSKTVNQGPKICENLSKTDNSQVSDFAHLVTSSISFSYEQSADDDSPIGAKSNSSDTLCQIMSLDQVSTPISPKIFPNRETPTIPKDYSDNSNRTKVESDDTCSAITSLIETDTLSSLSYPRSPSTGSYHPFPTRPPLRMPKELGVRLGMYPKDVINSPPN